MNIQSFYEYVILRDILAFILPGGISLVGFSIVVQALGGDRWRNFLPSFSNLNTFLISTFLIMIAFLIGHVLDMFYRLIFQKRKIFRRPATFRKILTGSPISSSETAYDPVANEIKKSVGQFLNINWDEIPIEQWIESEKAFEANVLLAYWIEQEDSRLFSNEIGRPIVQSHLLHVSGLAFLFLGACSIIAEIIHWVGINPLQASDPIAVIVTVSVFCLFGLMLIQQGAHKRDIIIEHVFRVFHVIWLKRVLEQRAGLEKPSITKVRVRSKKKLLTNTLANPQVETKIK